MLQPDSFQDIKLQIQSPFKFYRVGVLGDGLCLLHALLFVSNTDYHTFNTIQRKQFATHFLNALHDNLNQEDWIQYNLGESHSLILSHLRQDLESTHDSDELDELFQTMDLTTLQNKVPLSFSKIKTDLFKIYKQNLKQCRDLGYEEVQYIADSNKMNVYLFNSDGTQFYGNKPNPSFEMNVFIYNLYNTHWEPIVIEIQDKIFTKIPNEIIDGSNYSLHLR